MKRNRNLCTITLLLCFHCCFAQIRIDRNTVRPGIDTAKQIVHDTLPVLVKDSAKKKVFSPRAAAIRSAIFPGLGQIYNKKYWKLPIVYGALGTSAGVFFFNLREYKRVSFAYKVVATKDTLHWANVYPNLLPFVKNGSAASLRNYRNVKRKDIDYSVLVFLLLWGLNVVDATVDAHLKGFDVSSDLSLKVKPNFHPDSRTTGLSLAFNFHKGKPKALALP